MNHFDLIQINVHPYPSADTCIQYVFCLQLLFDKFSSKDHDLTKEMTKVWTHLLFFFLFFKASNK